MNSINVDFFLQIVLPKLIFSTLMSLAIAGVVGGIVGAIADAIRRKKYRSSAHRPPNLIFFAIFGSFIGTMLLAFLPIQADRNSLIGGPYAGLWFLMLLIILAPIGSILGAVLGCFLGAKWTRQFSPRNMGIGLGIAYLVMAIGIYVSLVPPPIQMSKTAAKSGDVLPVLTQISGYEDFIKDLVFTPDGQGLAIANKDGISIWDFQSQRVNQKFKLSGLTLKDMVSQLAFTPDGKTLISAAPEEIQIRDLKTGEIVRRLDGGHNIYPTPDGKKLVGTTAKNTYSSLLVWDLQDYQLLHKIPAKLLPWEDSGNPLSISPDSKTLIFAPDAYNNLIQVWDLNSGKQIKSFGSNNGEKITAMAISPDGKQLLTVYASNLYIWDVNRGKIIRTIPQVGRVRTALFTPNDRTLITNSEERLEIWDLKTGKPIKTIPNDRRLIRYLALRPDGKAIAVYENKVVKIWQLPYSDPTTSTSRRK